MAGSHYILASRLHTQSQSRQSAAYWPNWPIAIGPILYRMYAGIRAKQLYPLIGIRLAAGHAGGNQAADSQVQLLDMQLRAATEGHEVAISQDFAKALMIGRPMRLRSGCGTDEGFPPRCSRWFAISGTIKSGCSVSKLLWTPRPCPGSPGHCVR